MLPRRKPEHQEQQEAVNGQIHKEAGHGLVEKEPHALPGRGGREQGVPRIRNGPHGLGGEHVRVKVVAVIEKLHVRPRKAQRLIGFGHRVIGGAAVVGVGHAHLVKCVIIRPGLLRPGPFVHNMEPDAEDQHQRIGERKPPEAPELFRNAVLHREQIPEWPQA